MTTVPRADFAAVNRAALARLPDVLARLLPGGRALGVEWHAGSLRGEAGDSLRMRLRGELDAGALQRAITALADRHEVLRTVLRLDRTGETRQVIRSGSGVELPVVKAFDHDADEVAAQYPAAFADSSTALNRVTEVAGRYRDQG